MGVRIYLDTRCYNRPFDDQSIAGVREETLAILEIQRGIVSGRYELVWSVVLDLESMISPFFSERRERIFSWRDEACAMVMSSGRIQDLAETLCSERHLKGYDSLHVACAIVAGCSIFITTDRRLIKSFARTPAQEIEVIDAVDLIERMEGL